MFIRCSVCTDERYLDQSTEEFYRDMRCEVCGATGTMSCAHKTPDATGLACDACGEDFS